jgi:hypothetical protein
LPYTAFEAACGKLGNGIVMAVQNPAPYSFIFFNSTALSFLNQLEQAWRLGFLLMSMALMIPSLSIKKEPAQQGSHHTFSHATVSSQRRENYWETNILIYTINPKPQPITPGTQCA